MQSESVEHHYGGYPHNNGKAAELHLPISGNLPWFPELLRDAGYYTAIVGKHHMTSTTPRPKPFDVVDDGRVKRNGGGHGTWVKTVEERPQDKPFFFWFAAYDAHRAWDADKQWNADKYGPMHRPEDVVVPPFLTDDSQTRGDLASYYNEVTRYDYYIGEVVKTLKAQGALDDTLIFVLADNGRPFPRAKTRLHDSGMKTALVAHWPAAIQAASVSKSLVSVIDLAPTILKVAGVEPTKTMQGVSMQPLFSDPTASIRQYAFSEHNWHDYEALARSVRTADGWLYLQNLRPKASWQGPADSVRSASHVQLLEARNAGRLTAAQADVFLEPRPGEELYDAGADPHQLNNLAYRSEQSSVRERLAGVLKQWMRATGDSDPRNISADSFDREKGTPLKFNKKDGYRGLTPGEDKDADQINKPGPR